MFINLHKKGQSTLEYAVIIAVVVAALIAMQTYVKRGLQGRLRQASDDIGEQFSPGYTTANHTTTSSINSTEVVTGGSQPTTNTMTTQAQNTSIVENVSAADGDHEYWPD